MGCRMCYDSWGVYTLHVIHPAKFAYFKGAIVPITVHWACNSEGPKNKWTKYLCMAADL